MNETFPKYFHLNSSYPGKLAQPYRQPIRIIDRYDRKDRKPDLIKKGLRQNQEIHYLFHIYIGNQTS